MAVEYVEGAYRYPGELTPSEINILAYLGNCANPAGECWPKRSTIAARCRLHPDTVKTVLQELDRRGLIRREERFSREGQRIANRIVLLFDPWTPPQAEGGLAPVTTGVADPPASRGDGGQANPGGMGVGGPPQENPNIKPTDSVARWVKFVWDRTPPASRKKSTSKAELERALRAAGKRGHDLARVAEALRLYFEDPAHTRDDCRAMKGVHRVVENDRWQPWDPGDGDWPTPDAPAAPAPESGPDDAFVADLLRRQRIGRVEDWISNPGRWDRDWGPEPDQEGSSYAETLDLIRSPA